MEYPHSKPKPRPGFSYPLNRTALDAALDGLDSETIVDISFMERAHSDVVLRAMFTGEDRDARAAGRVRLYIYAVLSHKRKDIEQALRKEGLRLLRSWLDDVERAGSTWRAIDHSLDLEYEDGVLTTSTY